MELSYEQKRKDVTNKITWEHKSMASTPEEAVSALADFFSSTEGIDLSLEDKIDKAESFAAKWNIPFSRQLTVQMIKEMDRKRWERTEDEYGDLRRDHKWVSSTEECY